LNVDGQFRKAGFAAESVAGQHGSIHRLQCQQQQQPCADEMTWDAAPEACDDLAIDLDALEARGSLPVCPRCGQTARPNILMFNDTAWVDAVTRVQMQAFERWKSAVRGLRLVIVEIGAGTAIPTIRRIGERAAERARTTLVRINPEEEAHDAAENALVVPLPALQALTLIDEAMNGAGGGGAGRGSASRKNPKRESNAPPFQQLLPSRQMATVDPPAAAVPAARRRQTTVLPTALRAIHYVELHSGYTQVIDPTDLRPAELGYCLEQWYRAAQGRFMPLPVLRGLTLEGYTMRGQVVVVPSGNEAVDGAASGGAALLQIKDPRGELVVSVGFARRAREGAYLWRRLLEEASVAVQPTDYPQEPWIVRRVEPAARRNAAMMGALGFVKYAIGVAWLRRVDGEE
jgi:hypothetical protein